MAQVETHPTDEGMYQSTINDYGHGPGNGKSRSAVYKHNKSVSTTPTQDDEVTRETIETSVLGEEVESPADPTEWEEVAWLDDDDLPPPTIAAPIRRFVLGDEGMTALQRATQQQLIRWGFMGVDRGITHWGRGVTQDAEFEIVRHPEDYDALEAATTNLLDSYGVGIHLNPTTVFAVVVSAAYVPPITQIARKADLTIGGRLFRAIKSIASAPLRLFNRRRSRVGIDQNDEA
jgi:hypothetical protein